ncbi:hypothetical protein LV85_03444 [Algoriphagus chordae]|uniref:Uncharacterized protein n=1 Tax=Algoriphagus chordae TaxID=237019 RepID=A0A2W7QKK5_9BACT|nr:hypothetical protein LV85_03444 [Algoriphagus chordae]
MHSRLLKSSIEATPHIRLRSSSHYTKEIKTNGINADIHIISKLLEAA